MIEQVEEQKGNLRKYAIFSRNTIVSIMVFSLGYFVFIAPKVTFIMGIVFGLYLEPLFNSIGNMFNSSCEKSP